ncbi:MAG TPA: histidine phosphatase family protein, partial [Rhodospirillaceae bacterium]|nr:histidine phosphatase family protein [Rhodospirillaceae bacterium]
GLDAPLTDEGRAQAAAAAALLRGLEPRPGAVVHSPMIRARDTAAPLAAALGLALHPVEDLREHRVGAWEGMAYDAFRPLWASGATPPGGESHADFGYRVRAALGAVLTQFDTPLVVSHGGVFRALGALYSIEIAGIRNATLYHFAPIAAAFPWRVTLVSEAGPERAAFCGDTE